MQAVKIIHPKKIPILEANTMISTQLASLELDLSRQTKLASLGQVSLVRMWLA